MRALISQRTGSMRSSATFRRWFDRQIVYQPWSFKRTVVTVNERRVLTPQAGSLKVRNRGGIFHHSGPVAVDHTEPFQ